MGRLCLLLSLLSKGAICAVNLNSHVGHHVVSYGGEKEEDDKDGEEEERKFDGQSEASLASADKDDEDLLEDAEEDEVDLSPSPSPSKSRKSRGQYKSKLSSSFEESNEASKRRSQERYQAPSEEGAGSHENLEEIQPNSVSVSRTEKAPYGTSSRLFGSAMLGLGRKR